MSTVDKSKANKNRSKIGWSLVGIIILIFVLKPIMSHIGGNVGLKKAQQEIIEKGKRLNEPIGFWETYWLMTPRELMKVCQNCEPHPLIQDTYREIRYFNNTECAVTYHFGELSNGEKVLIQITITTKPSLKNLQETLNEYYYFRNYITSNIARLSEIQKKYDNYGNLISIVSHADFEISSLIHAINIQNGRAMHQILFFKKK